MVASDLEQIAELLTHGEDAVLVEPASATALAQGIRHVAEMSDLGANLGRKAREHAEERHQWDQRVRAILRAVSR